MIGSVRSCNTPGRRTKKSVIRALATAAVLAAAVAPAIPASSAPLPGTISLDGSNFEIEKNANIIVDHGGDDWASIPQGTGDNQEHRKDDLLSGPSDNSFAEGTKENDTAAPKIGTGSIPNNKSDLKTFGVYTEKTAADRNFLNLFWTRVQDPTGSTNMDFEFNQSATLSSNGVTPVRTAGDLLIGYDLPQSSVNNPDPTLDLSLRRWTGSQWGPPQILSQQGDATGGINTTAITAANADGLGALSVRTFGEAQLDLDEILGSGSTCTTFGSAYLKSRASQSFSSVLKDFIAPQSVQVSNCGSVTITKEDDNGAPLAGAEFTLFQDGQATTFTCTTNAQGICGPITNVPAGDYVVRETDTPDGYEPAPDEAITVEAGETVTVGPLVDTRQTGAIKVTKVRKIAGSGNDSSQPHEGVTFQVLGTTKSGVTAIDAMGDATVCFDGLPVGTSYTVHEVVPAGYRGEADKIVPVTRAASCTDQSFQGSTVTFRNTPLTNLTLTATPQDPGATASEFTCTNGGTLTPTSTTTTSATFNGLVPGTYTCTVVIDP
ncbi:collagen binding domain-containing protein [Streptomyces sp. NPDC012637]|uniref:MSCRAMM family protein n=1 Tax=Streptomyces sp. NPDC012637 TaxID=3364842 RepID=UPI0036E8CEF5